MKKIYHCTCIIFACLLLAGVTAHAQRNDYVITTQGDTLFGTVSNVKLTSIKFKHNGKGKAEQIFSPQAKEFRIMDDVFESKVIPNNGLPLFLERLETGTISLYKYHVYDLQTKNSPSVLLLFPPGQPVSRNLSLNNNSGHVTRLFASKNDGPLVEVKSNRSDFSSGTQREEAFEDLISDDPEILEEYSASVFNNLFLRSIVKKYNKSSLVRN
ncbi:hypothetical protein [Botryobacter ruber]|uniref:hypothetical protein n=1 Tax=Botryobacter ruber TaxID=2171629 RepID=UPI000F651104|nr:hypothetical protein [Botryobacter ruber]